MGGVPEVLPDDLIRLADPNITGEDRIKTVPTMSPAVGSTDLVRALEEAIQAHRRGDQVPHWEVHERVKAMYTWHNVARRTEQVPPVSPWLGGATSTVITTGV